MSTLRIASFRLVLSALGLGLAGGVGAAPELLLHYDFQATSTPYVNLGLLTAPLTPRGNFQSVGQAGSGVSGEAGDRAWDASANTTQGVATPANNAALTTPAAGLDFSTLSGFTLTFWFKTEQSLNGDSATRLVYKADRATTPVTQGLTLRSLSGALELRAGTSLGEAVVVSTDFGTASGYNRVGDWIFVALTWDGSELAFHYGGPSERLVPAGGGPMAGTIVDHTGNLVLGNSASFNRGLDGWIDNFRFYDGPLTVAELEHLRQADAGPRAVLVPGGPLRPLASDAVVLGQAGDADRDLLAGPRLLRLASGRLVAAYERIRAGRDDEMGTTVVLTSDDGGANWVERATLPLGSARVFAAGTSLYLLGLADELVISRSVDEGLTWEAPQTLSTGHDWHRAVGNVWSANGRVAVALLGRVSRAQEGWPAADLAPVLLVAEQASDLRVVTNWRWSNPVAFADVFAKFGGTGPTGRFFGVPFHAAPAELEDSTYERLALTPVGWKDPQVVQVLDNAHTWYDGTGRTWHLLLRAVTGGAGWAGVVRVTEQLDGSLQAGAQRAPSGLAHVLLPMPGAEGGFDLCYDAVTGLYWQTSTLPEDSMRRRDRGGQLFQRRGPLVLSFSRNLVDWCFAGVVAEAGAEQATLQVAGSDLVLVNRQRTEGAPEKIVFRRVMDFRALVY